MREGFEVEKEKSKLRIEREVETSRWREREDAGREEYALRDFIARIQVFFIVIVQIRVQVYPNALSL